VMKSIVAGSLELIDSTPRALYCYHFLGVLEGKSCSLHPEGQQPLHNGLARGSSKSIIKCFENERMNYYGTTRILRWP
jgi:hypothetical protein